MTQRYRQYGHAGSMSTIGKILIWFYSVTTGCQFAK